MWNAQEREILTLTVSGKTHQLDPMPLIRRYRAGIRKVGDKPFSEGLRQMLSGTETPEIAGVIMPVIRDTLQWPRFDDDKDNGYTEMEMLIAFTQFIEWLVESKKKDETLPSSAGSGGDSVEIQPTESIAALSSAEMSSNPEGLGLPPSAPA